MLGTFQGSIAIMLEPLGDGPSGGKGKLISLRWMHHLGDVRIRAGRMSRLNTCCRYPRYLVPDVDPEDPCARPDPSPSYSSRYERTMLEARGNCGRQGDGIWGLVMRTVSKRLRSISGTKNFIFQIINYALVVDSEINFRCCTGNGIAHLASCFRGKFPDGVCS